MALSGGNDMLLAVGGDLWETLELLLRARVLRPREPGVKRWGPRWLYTD